MMPRLSAIVTACVRSLADSFASPSKEGGRRPRDRASFDHRTSIEMVQKLFSMFPQACRTSRCYCCAWPRCRNAVHRRHRTSIVTGTHLAFDRKRSGGDRREHRFSDALVRFDLRPVQTRRARQHRADRSALGRVGPVARRGAGHVGTRCLLARRQDVRSTRRAVATAAVIASSPIEGCLARPFRGVA